MDPESILRDHLLSLLNSDKAHVNFRQALADLPSQFRGRKAEGAPHTIWEILEHMRLCQWDILEFSRNPKHVSPDWPEGYWPETAAPADESAWQQSIESFEADRQAMARLVMDSHANLYVPFRWGSGQTLLGEALLVVDHNAYHVGQIVLVRRLLGCWPAAS